MSPHFHPFHELIVIMSGAMRLKTRESVLTARAGQVLFYHAGLVHEEISERAAPVRSFFLSFRAGGKLTLPLAMQDEQGRIREMASWLAGDFRAGASAEKGQPMLVAILAELERLQSHPPDPWLAGVRSVMRERLAGELDLNTLAEIAGLSRFSFIRKYRERAGSTPMLDLRAMRVEEAHRLLLSSNLPLKAIAPACGLGDEYQLSKLLRRRFGMSAREIRARRASV